VKARTAQTYKAAIQSWGADIYTPINISDSDHWIPTQHLENLLNTGMVGLNLSGLPLRTRSKLVKSAVCEALGYPTPKVFKKTQPRFVGQQLDIYTQKSLNLQVWNEELISNRRYALIQVSAEDIVIKVKVVSGQELAELDTTGTLTTKYQARLEAGTTPLELVSKYDTAEIVSSIANVAGFSQQISPADEPEVGTILPIQNVFERLAVLIGTSFADPGKVQERNRGAALHQLVCQHLGYARYEDNGKFPDIRHQLLEVKLQTSATIDLGLVLPSSTERLDVQPLGSYLPRHCDTRYAIFQAASNGEIVTLTHLYVVNGQDFFTRFRQFSGKVQNQKIQISLPRDFFGH
jgi:hypothetical protein